ncbi:DUF885 family protein [Amycolatopsis pretoriensis]|nr:DUF885 family protein [Amycolatopsis pretoriensis]
MNKLSEEFWLWREATQPDSFDDVCRVQRPPGWLPEWSAAAVEDRRRVLAAFAGRYSALEDRGAPVADQVDRRLVGSALARVHWELNLLRDWQRNPGFYLDQSLGPVANLLLAPPPFTEVRAQSLVDCLHRVPAVLAAAEENLAGHAAAPFARCALLLLEKASEQLATAMAALASSLPAAQQRVLPERTTAACVALTSFRTWLGDRLSTFTTTTSAGAEAFNFFLHRVALLPYSVEHLRWMGRQEYQRSTAAELIARARHRRSAPAPLIADVAQQISRQREEEQGVRAFCRQRGLVDLPDDLPHYRNAAMPAYLEPLGWLSVPHHFPPPGCPAGDALRYIRAPREDLPYFELAEARDPRVGIAHEGVHAWQAALSSRNTNPVRRHYYDSAANEGIAFANEESLLTAGLFDNHPDSSLFVLNAMRLRSLRVEIDIGLALGELTIETAADRLAGLVGMDRQTAWAEAVYFAGHPGQGLSYQTGKQQVLDLMTACASDRPDTFDLAGFHTDLWSNGNVPLSLRRWELLGLSDHVDRARTLGAGEGPPVPA